MHEISIASAILESAQQTAPKGVKVTGVGLRTGPMRGIDPLAMEFAWQACTEGTAWEGVALEIESQPWRLACPDCGREFESEDVLALCACGGAKSHPVGGDELRIVSMTVEDERRSEKREARSRKQEEGPGVSGQGSAGGVT